MYGDSSDVVRVKERRNRKKEGGRIEGREGREKKGGCIYDRKGTKEMT